MKNREMSYSALAFVLLMTASCAAVQSSDILDSPSAASTIISSAIADTSSIRSRATAKAEFVTANNRFGFDIFRQLRQSAKDKNLFFSPISVMMALAMTYNGAAGITEKEMARTLRLDGVSLFEINQQVFDLLESLKSIDSKIELSIANSIWARKRVQFREDFLTRNRQFFGAEIASLDFVESQSLPKINGWVNASTKGKIERVIDQIDSNQVMFLINAAYFKGKWQREFDKKYTQDGPFYLLGGKTKTIPMMSQTGEYRYFRGKKFQALSIPYGKFGVSFYLFLPDENSSLNDLLNGLSYQKWEEWMKSFQSTPGDVSIPRFKLDSDQMLNDPLQALGMKSAFASDQADFSGMHLQLGLYLSMIKHKAVIEVNEEGTEAAAATSVGVATRNGKSRQPERFAFIADRPFLMAIGDELSGAILFLGAVMEPK